MGQRYLLKKYGLSDPFEVDLSSDRYRELVSSKQTLVAAITAEAIFRKVNLAYIDFEVFSFEVTVEKFIDANFDYASMSDIRVAANVKAGCFLNTLTAYRDQISPTWEKSVADGALNGFSDQWKMTRANSLDFDFCCHLRDYAQHVAEPIEFSSWAVGMVAKSANADDGQRESTWAWHAEVDPVVKFKREIRKSDRADTFRGHYGTRCDVSLLFRHSLSKLGEIHRWVRKQTSASVALADANLRKALNEMPANEGFGSSGQLLAYDGPNLIYASDIFSDQCDYLRTLRAKRIALNVGEHHFSSRAKGHQR